MDQTVEAPPGARVTPGLVARSLIFLIDGYRFLLSPLLGGQCRFHPTCSRYAREAILVHGAPRGAWLALTRLCRCHPLAAGGIDEVPGIVTRRNQQEPMAAERNH